jgi:hypothetical protein
VALQRAVTPSKGEFSAQLVNYENPLGSNPTIGLANPCKASI